METAKLKKVLSDIEKSGAKRFTLYCNNSYLIEVNSDSTRCVFDDANEMLYFFRVPNMVQPKDFRPIAIECMEYSVIERVCVPTDYVTATKIAEAAGLTIPDDVKEWLSKAASQSGLYPIQDSRHVEEKDNINPTNPIPSVR